MHAAPRCATGWLVPLTLIGAYWLWSSAAQSLYFPPLPMILAAFADVWLFERIGNDLLPSLGRVGAGFALSCVVGITIGTALGRSRIASAAAEPLLQFFRALPAVALIPFGLLVLGTGEAMKLFIIVSGAIWPVLLNTVDGVRSVDPTLLDLTRAYNVPRRARMWRVVLPSAAPRIFAGLRTSLSISIILMVVSEMVASTSGIGYFIRQAQRSFAIAEMWSGIILLGLVGYCANLLLLVLERRILHWHYGAHNLLADEGRHDKRMAKKPSGVAKETAHA